MALSDELNRAIIRRNPSCRSFWGWALLDRRPTTLQLWRSKNMSNRSCGVFQYSCHGLTSRTATAPVLAGSRADDSSTPFEMSVENAFKLLGASEGASFEDILRARNSILVSCRDDQDTVGQVEAAYDMLLMQSIMRRQYGKVVNTSIPYADVKPLNGPGMGSMPQWIQATVKNIPVSVEAPSTGNLGLQAGVYGALMVLTFANGTSTYSAGPYAGVDVPGLILAASFGASLYFLTKKNINLGKATLITVGGAAAGSAVENWLQLDIVPFFGINCPVVVCEFILFSQFLVSLYLR